jgi:hypothetical protein
MKTLFFVLVSLIAANVIFYHAINLIGEYTGGHAVGALIGSVLGATFMIKDARRGGFSL